MKRKAGTIRLILASFIGSLFSLTLFIGAGSFFLSLAVKTASTVMIVLIAYGYHSYKELSKFSLAVFLISTVFGGLMLAVYQLCRPPNMLIVNDVVYFEIDPVILIAITGAIYLILYLAEKLLHERVRSTVVRLTFIVRGQEYSCLGKVDTGCDLTEPFSKAPVIIVDKVLFPLPDSAGCRVIPYTTVGGSSLLYGVKAERVAIGDRVMQEEIYIAAGDIRNGTYRAVINSEILR